MGNAGWLKISFSREDERNGMEDTFQELCLPSAATAGFPSDAAIFFRDRPGHEGGTDLFISPNMAAIVGAVAEKYGAVACDPPPREGTGISMSNGDAWQLLM
jgi:hypothetical protein